MVAGVVVFVIVVVVLALLALRRRPRQLLRRELKVEDLVQQLVLPALEPVVEEPHFIDVPRPASRLPLVRRVYRSSCPSPFTCELDGFGEGRESSRWVVRASSGTLGAA